MQHLLLPSQKNSVFALIRSSELDPSQFRWDIVPSEFLGAQHEVSRLLHIPTGFFFVFDVNTGGGHFAIRSPGRDGRRDTQNPGSWDLQCRYAEEWVIAVAYESSQPDLWASMHGLQDLADAARMDITDDLSDHDRETFRRAVVEVKSYLLERNAGELDEEQFSTIVSRLDYLTSASDRLGRKDLMNVAMGILASIVVTLAMEPTRAHALFSLFVAMLSGLPHLIR